MSRHRLGGTSLATVLALGCGGDAGADGTGRVLVASGFTDQVFVLDGNDGRLLDSLSLNPRREETDEPHGLALAPDGRHWYATVSHGEASLWKFELPANRLVGRLILPTPGAGRIGITPDSRTAFVPDYWRGGLGAESQVARVRLEDLTLLDAPALCSAPHDAVVSGDGRTVAITCALSDELVLLDAATGTEVGRFSAGPDPGPPGSPRYRPLNAVWSKDDASLFVTMHFTDTLVRFDRQGARLGAVAVGPRPTQLGITPDGLTVIVANRGDRSASVVRASDLQERARVAGLGEHPHGVAIAGNRRAFISYEGSVGTAGGVVAIDLERESVLWRREIGSFALGVLALPPS